VGEKSETFLPKYPDAHTVRCSPDGRFIAFSQDRALYLYHTADGSVRKLTDGNGYDRFPSFVGDRVIFWRETRSGARQAVSIRADATDERVLCEGDIELAIPISRR
jgi:Tol biopolymer transport system component